MYESAASLRAPREHRIVARPDDLHLVRPYSSVVERRAPVWPALENGQVTDRLAYRLDDLHARSPGPDHRHPLAFDLHRRMRPARRMKGLPSKRLDALNLRPDRVRESTNACYQEPAPVLAPVPQFDFPASAVIVIVRGLDLAGKLDVCPKVELIGDVLQIPQSLRLRRKVLRPVPLVEQLLRKGVRISVALRIEPRPRVAIPVPRASHIRPPFEDPHPQAQLS